MEDILTWQKATKSSNGGECVEIGTTADGHAAGVRDSKSPERGHLAVTTETFGAFLRDVKHGRFDRLDATQGPDTSDVSGPLSWLSYSCGSRSRQFGIRLLARSSISAQMSRPSDGSSGMRSASVRSPLSLSAS
jgi:hypothetical protein